MPLVDRFAPIVPTPPEWPDALRVEIERLTDLTALPPTGFPVACVPLRTIVPG